mgnify:CR=1 FL=1
MRDNLLLYFPFLKYNESYEKFYCQKIQDFDKQILSINILFIYNTQGANNKFFHKENQKQNKHIITDQIIDFDLSNLINFSNNQNIAPSGFSLIIVTETQIN